MAARQKHDEAADRRHDATVEDSFPASDPPANSGVVGPRVAHPQRSVRPSSHARDDEPRPKGTPTDERHAAETGHAWEDEGPQSHRR